MMPHISPVIHAFHSIWIGTSLMLIGTSLLLIGPSSCNAELECYTCGFQNKNTTSVAECPAHFPPDGKDIKVQSCPVDLEWCGIALLGDGYVERSCAVGRGLDEDRDLETEEIQEKDEYYVDEGGGCMKKARADGVVQWFCFCQVNLCNADIQTCKCRLDEASGSERIRVTLGHLASGAVIYCYIKAFL